MSTQPAIALFTYNRPDKTARLLEALQPQNGHRLYIFCDGPRSHRDLPGVKANRQVARQAPWPGKTIISSPKNKGLARSLIQGITHCLAREDRLIVLEDDCLPLPGFLEFMERNLEHWEDRLEVFSISGHHFIRGRDALLEGLPHDTFLSSRFLCWGWATWRDRWERILPDLAQPSNPFGSYARVPVTAGADLPFHAYAFETNAVDSWAIPVALITLKQGMKHVMPRFPLIHNLGLDGSGTHCGRSDEPLDAGPSPDPGLGDPSFCPGDFSDPDLETAFNQSMMDPPKWFKEMMRP